MLYYYVISIGLIPFLASRGLIPIFATAMAARFGPGWEIMANSVGVSLVSGLPAWMTSDGALLILGLGAFVELVVTKSQDFRDFTLLSEPVVKGLVGFLLCFLLVEGNFMELLKIIQQEGVTTEYVWGHSFAYTWSFLIGWAVFYATVLRTSIYMSLMEMDPDDDLGLQGFLSWIEDLLGFFGIFFVLLMPVVAMVTAALTLAGLYFFRRYLKNREEKKKVPCVNCNTPRHLCATWCRHCQTHHQVVHQVGFLGFIKMEPIQSHEAHKFQMCAKRRCYYCGDHFEKKQINQVCTNCGQPPFHNRAELDTYLGRVKARLGKTLLISGMLGIVPLIGLIPAVIYYRMSLISSLRCYIPRHVGCMGRWIVRFVSLFMISLQLIPMAGILTIPALCMVNYMVYMAAFKNEGRKAFTPEGVLKPLPA